MSAFKYTALLVSKDSYPFKRQPGKMVKYTETIRRLMPMNCLSVFGHSVGLVLKGLRVLKTKFSVLF